LAYAALLPLQWKSLHITWALLAFGLAFLPAIVQRRFSWRPSKMQVLWFVYYGLLLAGITWSDLPSEGHRVAVLQITLLLWPLTLGYWPPVTPAVRHQVGLVFAAVVTLSVVYQVARYAWLYWTHQTGGLWNYTDVALWDMVPSHYQALYVSWATLVVLDAGLQQKKTAYLLWAAFLLMLLAFMAVRIQWLALPLAVMVYAWAAQQGLKNAPWRWMALGLAAMGIVVFAIPQTRERVVNTAHEIRSLNGPVDDKQTNPRVFLWREGVKLIGDNPFGVGVGAENKALTDQMAQIDARFWNGESLYQIHEMGYNFHNAFLQQAGRLGWLGLLVLILVFVGPWLQRTSALGKAFLVLTALSFSTESMLDRQAGVLFFGFFYALLFVAPRTAQDPQQSKPA
jgi:O-antigen ligase